MMANSDQPARTQEERSAAMRERLIEATLETILDEGYAKTTLVGIAKRAGVTRGALHHHYDSKDDLIVDAIARQLTDVSAEIREWAKLVQAGSLDLSEFLDRVWGLFSGRFFMVSLEQITASRHNDILRNSEPRRVFRRPFRLSHAAMAGSTSMA
jgi:AcrR family transcriptional regulator